MFQPWATRDGLRRAFRAARLLGFRAASSSWRDNATAARALISGSLVAPREREGPALTVVLLSYKRPSNLELQAHIALSAAGVRRVVVSHNAPSLPRPRLPRDPRLELVEQAVDSGPVSRYQVLRGAPTPYFVAIDDDLFLRPEQIDRLVEELVLDPEVPHGIYGQLYRDGAFIDNRTRSDGEVDILNRVYAFTRAHLDEYFRLLELIGVTSPEALRRLDDDIVLSFCGSRRPRIHDLGAFLDCPSERRRGIALWRRRDALALRRELVGKLRKKKPLAAPGPDAPPGARRSGPRSLPLEALVVLARLIRP